LDPSQASVVLDDPSVEGLHARLLREVDGSLRLRDEGSVAGTWVNFLPVAEGGQVLQHGDLIHFGRVGFRFTQRDPVRTVKPVITCLEQVTCLKQVTPLPAAGNEQSPEESSP
jgi:hypothetical protein